MAQSKQRIYKFDNVKALLIFLVVVGHLTTDYVGDDHSIRWFTLWIFTFHMPAFVLMSGLFHKRYITKKQADLGLKGVTEFRWDKALGMLLCAYTMKFMLSFGRTFIGKPFVWKWVHEGSVPWYLFVLAEYELITFLIRRMKPEIAIACAFVLSAVCGYFPGIGDFLCLSRMINFLPLYLIGYYMEPAKLLEFCNKKKVRIISALVMIADVLVCALGPWTIYSYRKVFTGRRSYKFLDYYLPGIMPKAWLVRLIVWALAIIFAIAVISLMPNKEIKHVSIVGERSLSVYFWHRPICYAVCHFGVYHALVNMTGGMYYLALLIYVLIGLGITWVLSFSIFLHPAKELLSIGKILPKKK